MRKTLLIGVTCFLVGAITTVLIFENYLVPLRVKRTDAFSLGESKMTSEVITRLENEFGLIENVNQSDLVIISNDEKVVILQEKNSVKTLKVYARKNH